MSNIAFTQKRNPLIDELKGIAILWVIACHFAQHFELPFIIERICSFGGLLPQFFFVVSAYLSWMSLSRGNEGWGNNLKKKFIRLAPTYYISLLLAIVITGTTPSVSSLFWHLCMLNIFSPEHCNDIIRVEWYVSELFVFLMIAPLLFRYVNTLKRATILLIISILLTILWTVTYNYCQGVFNLREEWSTYYHSFFVVNQLPSFAMGIFAFYFFKENAYSFWQTILMVLTSLLATGFLVFVGRDTLMPIAPLCGILFGMLFIIIMKAKDRIKYHSRTLEFVGKYSYGSYLLHLPLILLSANIMNNYNNHIGIAGGGKLLIYSSLYICLCLVSTLYGYVAEKSIDAIIRVCRC